MLSRILSGTWLFVPYQTCDAFFHAIIRALITAAPGILAASLAFG